MKSFITSIFLIILSISAYACPVCEKQQPKITQGWTHGIGPTSNWDWVIISIMMLITLLTLFYSVKYLVKPNESNTDHIKQSVLI
jgi:formate hydrogenlyase subunit 3/multisubunit Na+/H+ antiporter MnhD subunit